TKFNGYKPAEPSDRVLQIHLNQCATRWIVKPFYWLRHSESCPHILSKLRGEYGRLNQSLLFVLVRNRFAIRISPVFSDHFTYFETFPCVSVQVHHSVVRQIMCSRARVALSYCRSSLRAQHSDGVLPVQRLISVRMNASLLDVV
ncbi:hypothetical protein PSI22_12810, partial [Xenorhabdus sp. XENO-7]